MSRRTRFAVLAVSLPLVTYAVLGGLLGKAVAREDSYQHLRVFEDVVSLVTNNYVEDVDVDRVMVGAMRGLAEGLDADSAWLTPEEVSLVENDTALPAGDTGIELTRQYYLRVIATRDGSPAAKAGLRTGDFVRAIDNQPTRDLSVFEGMRLLRGPVGSSVTLTVIRGNAAEPHQVSVVREATAAPTVTGRVIDGDIGYVRIPALDATTVTGVRTQVETLQKSGAARLVVDVRSTAQGSIDAGLDVARLFVAGDKTLAQLETRGQGKTPNVQPIVAGGDTQAITLPMVLLTTNGTSGPAEVLVAALVGNERAVSIGERTLGRAAQQKLIKLPDGSGLWMTNLRYLTPDGKAISGNGIEPAETVDVPDVEFGSTAPTTDVILQRAIAHFTERNAA